MGLRKFLESRGHTFVVTSDKDSANSVFERELADAEIVTLGHRDSGSTSASRRERRISRISVDWIIVKDANNLRQRRTRCQASDPERSR